MTDEPSYEFDTMTNIGASYGLTSHELGRLLTKYGLRTDTAPRKPTALAFHFGMVKQKFDSDGHYCWAWHVTKTSMFLQRLGYERKTETGA